MKKKELESYRSKSYAEMTADVLAKQKELTVTVAKMYSGKEKNLKAARKIRHEIAQILSIMTSHPKETVQPTVEKAAKK
jgi:ribosomal protein L29